MGVTTSVLVCCLTCSSVAVKIQHYRSDCVTANGVSTAEDGARSACVTAPGVSPVGAPRSGVALTKEFFTPGVEIELENTGSGRTVCPVCCEDFREDRTLELTVLECVHAYHFACLESYALNRPNSKDSPLLCPVCQKVAVSR